MRRKRKQIWVFEETQRRIKLGAVKRGLTMEKYLDSMFRDNEHTDDRVKPKRVKNARFEFQF